MISGFITKIYLYRFFADLIFIYPVYSVMFVDHGLSPIQISILLMTWAGTSFILEVPSGVLADKYSRKNILALAQIIRIAGYLFWILRPDFFGFLIGFILWGVQSAFTSGTLESFVFDELKAQQLESRYTKVWGQLESLGYLALLFSGVGAALAVNFGYSFVLVISLISLVVSTITVCLIPSVKAAASTEETKYFALLRRGLKASFKNIPVLKIIVFVSLVQALFGALDEYWPIFANEAGLARSGLGVFFALYGSVQILASLIAYRLEKLSSTFFEFLFVINGLLLLAASYFYRVSSLVLLLLFSFLFKLIDVVLQSRLQHQVTEVSVRATITSVKGFFVELTVMALYLIMGLMAKSMGYQSAFGGVGIIISVIGMIYLGLELIKAIKTKERQK